MAAGSHGVWGHGRVPTPGEAELARLRERFRGRHIFHDVRWAREVRYLLAGLLACGLCGRRMESAWSNGKAAYRCRHGRTSETAPDPSRPKNAYVREDKLLPHLPALYLLLTSPATRTRRRIRAGADVRSTVSPAGVAGYLREHEITLTWNPGAAALQARATGTAKTVTVKAS
jgi:site-specific DNA recombinase